MSEVTPSYSDPANFQDSRVKFRDALWTLGIYGSTAETAADLFAQVVGKTMAELVPETIERMRPVVKAALIYRHQQPGGGQLAEQHRALFAAVDEYERRQA